MNRFPRVALIALMSVAAVSGCEQNAENAADKPVTAAQQKDPNAIPGLATEKERVSYMVGMDLAKSLEPVKDEIDLDTMNRALKASLAGEKALMTEEQAQQVREAFTQKMQTQQVQKMMAAAKENETKGQAFLAENAKKPGVQTTASGLQYQVLSEGTGPKPKATDAVRAHYKGMLLDGKVFDSSYERGEPATFVLPQMVPGWQEGIPLMNVGSKYRFWIPSKLGYGEQGTPGGPIPPNATLVFEVELLDIAKQPAG
ncbi:FKBP-type peptidyl-prolyl cis-trans isomerase [Lysobacter korlensis]|uniref:Peptidyl-prolyl cis-trans isomerase n=1 Tax=Lysobacter korlensis TaxID=553636 RepID=A0ABV6RQL2_9GAMM